MAKKPNKKFKVKELNAVDAPVKDLDWEGEEVTAQSDIKLESDTGTGQAVVLKFFDFGVNPETFKQHKPTAQELFNSHLKGIESLLWRDELKPFDAVQPRLMFSKDKSHYRFIIPCIPKGVLTDKTKTLTQIVHGT